jgi:signal transduction histidine kinase
MTQSVEESFRRERAFTRYASHELRTPLSAIQLQVEALRLGIVRRQAAAEVLERNVRRVQRVLDALLSLARVADQPSEPMPVYQMMDDVLEALDKADRTRLEVTLGASPHVLVGSPSLVAQAVHNLLGNAFRHTSGDVLFAIEQDESMMRFSVKDRGPGIPDEAMRLLDHSYPRLPSTANGTGLGLAFVKQVAEALGGDLYLRNLDDGFEAEVVFPVVVRNSAALVHSGHRIGRQTGHDQRK